jgi:hypothetical protein
VKAGSRETRSSRSEDMVPARQCHGFIGLWWVKDKVRHDIPFINAFISLKKPDFVHLTGRIS